MNRKITAFCAALLLTASVFSGCSKKTESSPEQDVTFNVIENGTEAATAASGSETTEFIDPADVLGFNTDVTAPDADTIETAPPIDDDIIAELVTNDVTVTTTRAPILKEYNIDHTTRYGYNQLNSAEKKLYDQILEGAKSVSLKVKVDDSVTDEMWLKVYGCVYMQEPQLFWMTSRKVERGKLRYWETDPDTIASMQNAISGKVSEILAKAEGKSAFDQIKVFHDYICLNNDFVKEQGFNQTIYGGFVSGTLQCEGYAKSMQYLCDMVGIESVVIVGTNNENASHAWNKVKVDGEWYNIDCTWDDPILKTVDHTNIRYRYFLVPDEWIHDKSHFNVNKKTSGTQVMYFEPPVCKATAKNYFNVTNQIYSDKDSADAALRAKMKEVASSKLRAAEIRVSSKEVYDQITADLKSYATWIKGEYPSVTSVSSNCDPNTLVLELDLMY